MIKHFFALSCFAAMCLASCQKDLASKSNAELNRSATSKLSSLQTQFTTADSTATWYGSYAGYYGPYPIVAESDFIKNGVAEDPAINQEFSYSNISLDIPPAYNISGDSIIFEVVAKNPVEGSFYAYDIVLQMVGEEHSAELHFVADASAQQYNQFYVGDKRVYNLPVLVQSFENYKTIRLALRKDAAAASINNNLLGGFKYGESNRIGRLKTINVAGKGFVIVDNVRVLNSQNNKPILSEDFNGDGMSHTIFY